MQEVLIRSFLAIDLLTPMQTRLGEVISILKRGNSLPVRWVPGKNIHLTVKFLGESEPSRVMQLGDKLEPLLKAYEPFEIQVGGLGAFPSMGNPRVIWIGVQAPPVMEKLVREIEEISAIEGFERENRRFSPHLTLGRVSQSVDRMQTQLIKDALQKTQVASLGLVRVESIMMMKSLLTPAGPIYSPLSVMRFSC
jgi:RNA 2',3'-cyclic 3'-phosphodiesterase